MKHIHQFTLQSGFSGRILRATIIAIACLLSVKSTHAQSLSPAPTAPRILSYQGMIVRSDGSAIDSECSVRASLYGDPNGTSRIWQGTYSVPVAHGVFNVALGSGAYPLPPAANLNQQIWLGVALNNGKELQPLAQVAASAYALNVADSSITAAKMATDYVSSVQLNGQNLTTRGGALNFEPGQGITMQYDSLNQTLAIRTQSLSPLTAVTYGNHWWGELGNDATTPGVFPLNYVGTADSNNLEIHVYDDEVSTRWSVTPPCATCGAGRVMRYEWNTDSPNLIGGFHDNRTAGTEGSVIGGGGYYNNPNTITQDYGVIGGGDKNSMNSYGGTLTGGELNTIASSSSPSSDDFIGGGYANWINSVGGDNVICGGAYNKVLNDGAIVGGVSNVCGGQKSAFIGSGSYNTANGNESAIAGGESNTASGSYSNVPGGLGVTAQGYSETALGYFDLPLSTSTTSHVNATDPVLTVGNGNSATKGNAFYVSNSGHSVVYDNSNGSVPIYYGGRYSDNTIVGWGDIPGGTGSVPHFIVPNSEFGVAAVYFVPPNEYDISLNPVTQNSVPASMTGYVINYGAVVATIEYATGVTDPGCASATVTPIIGNAFKVYTHAMGEGSCNATAFPFMFQVCGR